MSLYNKTHIQTLDDFAGNVGLCHGVKSFAEVQELGFIPDLEACINGKK
jgi:hypothetical protein